MNENNYIVAPWLTNASKDLPKLSNDARLLRKYRENRNRIIRKNAAELAEDAYWHQDKNTKGTPVSRVRAAERELTLLASYNAQHPIEGRSWYDYASLPEVEALAPRVNNIEKKQTPNQLKNKTKYTPKPITGSSYKVKYGDTLSKIARRAGMTVKEIAALNNIEDPNKIIAGQTLKLENVATKNAAKRAAEYTAQQMKNYYESNFTDEPVDLSSLNESTPVSDEAKEQYLTDAYNQGAPNRYFDAMDYYGAPQQTNVQPQEDYSPVAGMMTPQNVAAALYNNYWRGR